MQPWGWNIYNKMEYAVINQGGLASVDAYIAYLMNSKDFLELTKTKFEDIIKSRKLGEIIINCLHISRAGNKLKSKIIGCIPAVPTIKEIENPFDWFLSDRAKNEIKIKLAIIKDLISKLNELLKTEYNLEIIKEG